MHNRTGYYGTILYTSLILLMSIITRWGLRGLPTSSETDTKYIPLLVLIALSAFVVNSSASCCVQTTLSKTNSEVNFPHKTIGVCNSTPKACLCILHSRNIYSIEHISSLCRGHPLVGVIGLLKKKRRNLYLLPSYSLRLLALPYLCRTATQKPTLVYAINALWQYFSRNTVPKAEYYISTGIYRCLSLDIDMKFCENFGTVKNQRG